MKYHTMYRRYFEKRGSGMKIYTMQTLADEVGCSKQTIRKAKDAGEIEHFKVGELVRFSQGMVDAWIQSKTRKTK